MQPAPSQPSCRARAAAALECAEVAKARDAAHEPRRLDARGLRDGDHPRDGVQQLDPVRRRLDAQLEAVVLDAHAHRGDAVARRGDRLGAQQAAGRLDREREADVPGRDPPRRLERLDAAHQLPDLLGRLRLGQGQAVESRMDGRGDVVPQVRGVIVHPHHHLRAAAAGERQRVHDEAARARLLGGGHRVLEVEHDGVRAAQRGLLHEARHVDGQDQRRPPRAEPGRAHMIPAPASEAIRSLE